MRLVTVRGFKRDLSAHLAFFLFFAFYRPCFASPSILLPFNAPAYIRSPPPHPSPFPISHNDNGPETRSPLCSYYLPPSASLRSSDRSRTANADPWHSLIIKASLE